MQLTSLRHTLPLLLWIAAAAYVVYAAAVSRRIHADRRVERLAVEIVDSSSQGQLVSVREVKKWLAQAEIPTIGTAVDAVELTRIEQLIARNGFVDQVAAWVSYAGTLHIDISQRKPLLRLLTDGMNAYVTAEGYVFAAPRASSLYVPVVTGPYRPPFPASYAGLAGDYVAAESEGIARRIDELEREKYPFFKRELQNDRKIAELRRMVVKRRWWRFESDSVRSVRREELRAEKKRLRRKYRYEERMIREGIDRICDKQQQERAQQKKLEKSYEDFMKLLTFVKTVEKDDFWRSEIVQITARTTSSGALELELTPRSSRAVILFGRIERIDAKLDKLSRFYRHGLSSIGWDTYGTIDIRYRDQVVCRK